MVASGHKVGGMHGRYTNLQDWQIAEAFNRANLSRKILTPFKRQSEADRQQLLSS